MAHLANRPPATRFEQSLFRSEDRDSRLIRLTEAYAKVINRLPFFEDGGFLLPPASCGRHCNWSSSGQGRPDRSSCLVSLSQSTLFAVRVRLTSIAGFEPSGLPVLSVDRVGWWRRIARCPGRPHRLSSHTTRKSRSWRKRAVGTFRVDPPPTGLSRAVLEPSGSGQESKTWRLAGCWR